MDISLDPVKWGDIIMDCAIVGVHQETRLQLW